MASWREIQATEMVAGDIVTIPGFEYEPRMAITIYRHDGEAAYGWRPYVHVNKEIQVPYIGVESMTFFDYDTRPYTLLARDGE